MAASDQRQKGFWPLAFVFALFVLFLYGPVITIFVLSFQGPEGGLVFPMRGTSLHWYRELWKGLGVVDIGAALRRSLALGAVVMALTVLLALSAGLAFRKKLTGGNVLFYVTVASLIMPSIIVSLGIGLQFRLIDGAIKWALTTFGSETALEGFNTSLGLYTSGLGAHLTWTLPFGLLIMFAVFNRFNPAYEEAARDQGATPWQTFWHVVLPLIGPSVVGIGMFGFTLSWDEIARSSQAIGDVNTLPLELQGLTTTVTSPAIYALGTVTTMVSLVVITLALVTAGLAGPAQPPPRGLNLAARHTAASRAAAEPASEPAVPPVAADRVYDAIYAAVIDHRLAPGSRLREEELAQTFAVSRTLVRQALHKLAQDGVIVLRPNKGAQVPEPTRRDGEHVFDARRVVECEVARRLAGKLSAEQLSELRQLVEAEARATKSQNKQEAIRLSGEFHLRLARMSGNPIFVRLLEELLPTTSLLMALYKAPGEPMCVAHSHRQLLQVIGKGATGASAATEMRRHLNEIERSLSVPAAKPETALRDVFRAYRAS